ncbi:MAG: hypothetical protein AAFV93_23405, partial [Chloroflexota bacterium]
IITLIVIGNPPERLLTHLIGNDIGDNYEMLRNIWWFRFAIETGEPIFYQSWLGYPDGINGAIFISVPLQYFPMWALAFIMPLHVAYNLTIVLWMTLNGWAMFLLVRYLLDDDLWLPPFIAGIVYLAFPIFQGHLAEGHAGLMVAWAVPLYIWALFRYTSTDRYLWQWLFVCILFFYLSTTGHILQSIYVLMPVTGTFLLVKLWQGDWEAVKRIIGMGLLSSVLLLVILAPAILDATSATYSSVGGFTRFSADALAIVSPSFLHPTFGQLDYTRSVNGINLGEGLAYLGMISTLFAVIALWNVRETLWWALLAGIAWLFSLGPVLKVLGEPLMLGDNTIPLPFALLQNLPGFSLARTPARFNFTLALAIAVLVGYGLGWLWHKRNGAWRYGLTVLVACGIAWEYQSFWGQPMRSVELPDAVTSLREDDSIRAVLNIPYQHDLVAKDALFYQIGHEQPLIAGQITRTTPVNPAKLAMLQTTLDPQLLSEAGADIVILHHARADEIGMLETLSTQANNQLGEAIYRDEQIAIYRVPSVSSEIGLDYTIDHTTTTLNDEINLVGHAIYDWQGQQYVWLQWQFDEARPDTDVRFVHILDEAGEIVLQDDISLGAIDAGEVRTELLVFDMSQLVSGTYTIRTGWYDFSTLTNYRTEDGRE